ncbi:glycosyltransferase [Rhodohalobacter sp. SW132]|uniref:glycosyltransferase family 2 protein n=1 Tax=Rhodohalobacter sp. SW132 TaxID=2293433 RepID=UPI000E24FEE1|nr:glycosyltransferase [Rhodohalobacter sp. SW132]REL33828.1 glycosyltransferase [Rhodohalobacter sp. SW132]
MYISVIVPLYNKEKYITETIHSVLNQKYKNFEIIVVNDGSTDNSVNKVRDIKDEKVKLVNKNNGGEATARNRGIEEANYKLISFLDADDIWYDDYLLNMVDLIKEYPEAGMYCSGYNLEYPDKIKRKRFIGLKNNYKGLVEDYLIRSAKSSIASSDTVVIRKDVFKKVGFFNTSLNHGPDLDMWFKIALNYKVAFYNFPGALHKKTVEGRVSDRNRDANLPYFDSLIANVSRFCPDGKKKDAKHYLKKRYQKKIRSLLFSIQLREVFKVHDHMKNNL